MLFTKNNRFKDNFLVAFIGTFAEKQYHSSEYEVYDEIHNKYENGGMATASDIEEAVRNFRNHIAQRIFECTDREYQDTLSAAENFLKTLADQDYGTVRTFGPDPSIIYSIVVKMVRGDEYKFKFLSATDYMPDSKDDIDFELISGTMIARLEQFEQAALKSSFEMLIIDGTVDKKMIPEFINM